MVRQRGELAGVLRVADNAAARATITEAEVPSPEPASAESAMSTSTAPGMSADRIACSMIGWRPGGSIASNS